MSFLFRPVRYGVSKNVTSGPSGEDAILMFVIGGDGPKAEFTDAAMKELEDAGVWPRTTG